MRRPIALAFFVFFAAGSVLAQNAAGPNSVPDQPRSWLDGYLVWGATFFTERSIQTGGSFGVGLNVPVWRGLGAGGEIGVLSSGGDALGMASLNATYQFARSPYRYKGIVPFVSGGFTSGSTGEAGSRGGNFGGGMTWWFRERLGLKVEARDFFFTDFNCITIRAGISFR